MKKYRLLVVILLFSASISAQTGSPDYTWYAGKVSPFSISSTDQLLALSNIVNGTAGAIINNGIADNFAHKNINLTTNLDLSNYNYPGGTSGWISIGNKASNPFKGYFDGQNYTIKNLVSGSSIDTLVGLFGYVKNGRIGQLNLEDIKIQLDTTLPTNHNAGLVAYLEAASDSAIVENCSVSGFISIAGWGTNGGLVGSIYSNGFAVVRNCISSVNLLNGDRCGMIGHLFTNRSVTVSNCTNNGNISCTATNRGNTGGGLIGHVSNYNLKQCIISNCANNGEVSNFYTDGGIIGRILGGPIDISNCCNTAKIYNGLTTGGIIGLGSGLFRINSSYNSGLISSSSTSGGIVGTVNSSCTITNSYNTGDILVPGQTSGTGGGITGWITATWYDTTAIKNCYNTGIVVGDIWGDAGGIAGFGYTNNYGFISIRNSVSMGCSLSGYITGCGRIMGGFEGDVSLQNNYGWLLTKVNNSTVINSNKDGVGFSSSQAATATNWWNGTTGYFNATGNSTVKPDDVWVFGDNQLPVLKSMPGQLSTWPDCVNYTVSYNTNGGNEITDEEVSMYGRATRPVNPVRPGYTFIEWCSDSMLNNVYDFTTLVASDTTLYARWETIIYTVSYNTNGGSVIVDQDVDMYKTATRPVNPTRPGYTFMDWYTDQSLSYIFDFNTLIIKHITLYAKWGTVPVVLNPEKISASNSCSGDYAVLTFGVKTGYPAGYKIVFGTKAITAGFTNSDYIPILIADSTIVIPVASSVPEGSYTATLFIRDLAGNESPGYAFTITKWLSAEMIVGKFTNLVLCDNSLSQFEKYQWYKNGMLITDADKQYYEDEAGRGGNSYQVQVISMTGDTLMSCPKTFVKSQIATVNLKLFPNPVAPGEMCTLKVEGLTSRDIEGASLTIYNSYGTAVYRSEKITESNKITVPGIDGIYVCELVTLSGESYSCKILLSR